MSRSKTAKAALKHWTDNFLSVFFPLKCLACGTFIPPNNAGNRKIVSCNENEGHGSLHAVFENEMRSYLCPLCRDTFTPMTSPLCTCCGKIFNSREGEDRLCGQCLDKNPKNMIRMIRSVGVYDSAFMEVVRSLKYNGKVQLAGPFGRLMQKVFSENWQPDDIDVIIPVPLHKKRLRERGFNQSWLMIKNWPENFGQNKIHPEVMERKKRTRPQIGLSRTEREKNIQGAFDVVHRKYLNSKHILLVDDVFTTGATLNECARELLSAGARSIDALTLARAL